MIVKLMGYEWITTRLAHWALSELRFVISGFLIARAAKSNCSLIPLKYSTNPGLRALIFSFLSFSITSEISGFWVKTSRVLNVFSSKSEELKFRPKKSPEDSCISEVTKTKSPFFILKNLPAEIVVSASIFERIDYIENTTPFIDNIQAQFPGVFLHKN